MRTDAGIGGIAIKIYLAGAISWYVQNKSIGAANSWRDVAEHKFNGCGVQCFNPVMNVAATKDNFTSKHDKGVVAQNIHYLKKCDIVIVNIDHLSDSPGTIFEMVWAYIHNKPVIAFGEDKWGDQAHIKETITYKAASLDDAIDYIFDMYGFTKGW